jgi:hypothetical protein
MSGLGNEGWNEGDEFMPFSAMRNREIIDGMPE